MFKLIRLAYLEDMINDLEFEKKKNKALAPHTKHFDKAKKHKSLLDDIINMAEAKGDTKLLNDIRTLQQQMANSIKEGDEASEALRKRTR